MAQSMNNTDIFPTNAQVLRLRGLPYSVTEEEIRTFFSDFELDSTDPIVIITQGFHRGEGYARFTSSAVAAEAYAQLNRHTIGDRYIELYPSTDNAMEIARKQQEAMANSRNVVLRLRGLPFQVTEQEIRDFFENIRESIESVQLCINVEGRPTGDAFLEVSSEEAVQAAMEKNKMILGTRYIEIFSSSPHERDILLTTTRRGRARNGKPITSNNTTKGGANSKRSGGGSGADEDDEGGGGALAAMMMMGPMGLMHHQMHAMGGGAMAGGGGAGSYHGGLPTVRVGGPRVDVAVHRGSSSNGGGGMGGDVAPSMQNPMMMGQNPMMMGPDMMMDGYGAYGSGMTPEMMMMMMMMGQRPPSQFVVRIRGLPFSANEGVVAEFFHDVNIPPQGVHMVYNAQERPTGEAFVEVMSERDVMAALAHNGAALGHRYIEVFRSSDADMNRLAGAPDAVAAPPMMAPYVPPPPLMATAYSTQQQQPPRAMAPGFVPPTVGGLRTYSTPSPWRQPSPLPATVPPKVTVHVPVPVPVPGAASLAQVASAGGEEAKREGDSPQLSGAADKKVAASAAAPAEGANAPLREAADEQTAHAADE